MPMPDALTAREAELLAALAHTGSMQDERVPIPGTTISLLVTRPASIDQVLDQSADDPEQNLPYWAELWPSGIALAGWLVQHRDRLPDGDVLELGCGIGITCAIAAGLGCRVIATDYAPEALTLTRLTTLRHAGREPETARVNWRDASTPLLDGTRRFPLILAADVLYERRDIAPLLDVLGRILAPDGVVLLAEPERTPAKLFLEQAGRRGWQESVSAWSGPWPDPKDAGVVVRIHELGRDSFPGTP
jgi:predicted nicotinamide N-methyase